MRASPLSMTAVTPSIVTRVSATFVDRITLRRSAGRTARVLLAPRAVAVQRQHGRSPPPRRVARAPRARAGSRRARQEHEHVAVEPSCDEPAHAPPRPAARAAARRAASACSIFDLEAPALGAQDGAAAEVTPRPARRRASRTSRRARGRAASSAAAARSSASARSPCEVPLVELVEHDARRRPRARVREQPPRQHALGHEAQARARPTRPRTAPDSRRVSPDALAALLGDAPRGHARRDPPRLQHDDLAARPRAPRRAARAARAWSCPRRAAPR